MPFQPNQRRSQTRCAFSLVEMLTVVVILGVLAMLAIPRIVASNTTAKKNACYANCRQIELAVERYRRDSNAWPSTNLSAMIPTTSYEYFPNGLPVCPVDGSAYTIDGTTHKVVGHTH